MTTRIPFVDLRAQYETIKEEIDDAIGRVIRESAFIGGPHVSNFEKAFADYCGVRYAVGLSNGTDALRLALIAAGVQPGDEVITVPNTFIATTEAITAMGGVVRFVDVEPERFGMDPELLERAITRKTAAIVPVHLYGQPAAMTPILDVASRHGIRVIADAAQAHGAMEDGQPIGILGDVASFSFYPGKNLGAYGDAGAIVTQDRAIAVSIAKLRDHGRLDKYEHDVEGFNCRLDGVQAAILSVKLQHMERWTEARRRHASRYTDLLADVPEVMTPRQPKSSQAVYHLYVIQVDDRDAIRKHLEEAGISTGIHYPIPLHRQPAYARLKLEEGSFPIAEAQARRSLSLPMYPELTDKQLDRVVASIRETARHPRFASAPWPRPSRPRPRP